MSTSQKDFYRILGVTDNAEMAVVKAAYKALMMIYHPDRYDGDREEAIKKTKEINEAYTVLIDPDKRRHYTKSQFGFKASYEQVTEPEQTNTSSEKSNDLESGWLIAVELVEGLDEL
jgi:DnaJ-class molecular chaperone